MESPLKRRRLSTTRPIDISPIQIAPEQRGSGSGSGSGSSSINSNSITRGVPAHGANAALRKVPSIPSHVSPARASIIRKKMTLKRPTRRSFVLEGPTNEDIFDVMKIGTEERRRGPSPLSVNTDALRNSIANRARPRLSASPARSPRASSTDTSASKAVAAAAATVGAHGVTASVAVTGDATNDTPGQDQENTPDGDTTMDDTGGRAASSSRNIMDTSQMEESILNDGTLDPELPTLPAQLGLEEMPTPPQGLLSSSPSGRKLRRLNRQRSTLGNTRTEPTVGLLTETEGEDSRIEGAPGKSQPGKEKEKAPVELPPKPSGPIITWDKAVEQRQNEYEDLMAQKAKLEMEVRLLRSVLPGLESRETGKRRDSQDERHVLNLLLSKAKPKRVSESAVASPASRSLDSQLAGFLPFAVPTVKSTETQESRSRHDSRAASAMNPLENLSYFTTFKTTNESQTIEAVSRASDQDGLRLRRKCSLTSPDNTIGIDLEVAYDPVTQKIEETRVSSEQAWIEQQLLSQLRRLPRHRDALTRPPGALSQPPDPAALSHAAARFWELARLRADTWAGVFADHADLLSGSQVNTHTATSHISRQVVALAIDANEGATELAISWEIVLDDSLRAASHVDAALSYPNTWRDADSGGSLDGIGRLFHLLVTRHGVRRAVSLLVDIVLKPLDPDQTFEYEDGDDENDHESEEEDEDEDENEDEDEDEDEDEEEDEEVDEEEEDGEEEEEEEEQEEEQEEGHEQSGVEEATGMESGEDDGTQDMEISNGD